VRIANNEERKKYLLIKIRTFKTKNKIIVN